MKNLLKLTALLLTAIMLCPLFLACNSSDNGKAGAETEKPTETETPTEKPTERSTNKPAKQTESGEDKTVKKRTIQLASAADKIKTLGRTVMTKNGIACDHTASGIEFNAVMTGELSVKVSSTMIKSNSPKSYFTVYIDGVRQEKRYEAQGVQTIKLAEFEEEDEHNIRIVKQTETNYTLAEFREINMTGYLADPTPDNELYIEFIGDSLTCGMGNIGENSSPDPQSALWEDGSQSYGYMTAQHYEADYSIISESGIGISGSWSDHTIFPIFEKASLLRDRNKDFEATRVPDLVVINLGTNDYYINKDREPKGTLCKISDFEVKTEEFILLVRELYGNDVPIVWVSRFVGIGDNYVNVIDNVINKLGGESNGLYRLDVTRNTGGAQGHPTVDGHQKAFEELTAFIDSKNLL